MHDVILNWPHISTSHSTKLMMPSSPERPQSYERSRDRHSSHRSRDDGDKDRSHHHHRHHRSHHHRDRDRDRNRDRARDGQRKRSREDAYGDNDKGSGDKDRERHRHSRRRRKRSHRLNRDDDKKDAVDADDDEGEGEGEWVEAAAPIPAPTVPISPPRKPPTAVRDSWMLPPSATDVEIKHHRAAAPPKHAAAAQTDYRPIIHKNELNAQLRAGKSLDEYADDDSSAGGDGVDYEFGDSGSKWRMAKLKRVYETAKEEGRMVDEVALERYGDLKLWDDAREEEEEVGRREAYGVGRVDAKKKPTGQFYKERMARQKIVDDRRTAAAEEEEWARASNMPAPVAAPNVLDGTQLNKLRAALMKAQLKGDPKAAQMEKEYNEAKAAAEKGSNGSGRNEVVLTAMDHRALAGLDGRMGKSVISGKKGKLLENDDMSIQDMMREEKRTRGQCEGRVLAEKIARDAKFTDNLDYLDENAGKLAQRIQKNEIDIKNVAIGEFQKMQRVLDNCPLCSNEEKGAGPVAPVVSLATRTFLTLPTQPEATEHGWGAMIIPIQHRKSMLDCDDDEWEEVRNFMKSLTRLYASLSLPLVPLFHTTSLPSRPRHAAITAIPLPPDIHATAPAYFKEAILAAAESDWSQHKPLIDTRCLGRYGLRKALAREAPFFHVWYDLDGGVAHVVEDERAWPRGELFVREVVGEGMTGGDRMTWGREGRWRRGEDKIKGGRVDRFREKWAEFDWTKVLYDA